MRDRIGNHHDANGIDRGPREHARWWWLHLAAILTGAALRVWQYAANPSIWVDEAAIARNVLDRRAWELFSPLNYGQVAPPGFLLGIKLSATVLGPSEYALRLVPFVCGITSLWLLFIVARSVLRPVGAFVATLMFATAIPLIFVSSNLKQYSSDIAITLLVVAITIRLPQQSLSRRSAYAYAIVAVPLLFSSQAAVFPITIAGAVVLADALRSSRPDRSYRLMVVGTWAAASIVAVGYSYQMMTTADAIYLRRFWAHAFVPREESLGWLWTTAQNIFAGSPPSAQGAFDGSLQYPWPAVFTGLLVIGAVALVRSAPARGTVIVGPIALALAAAAAHVFPVGTRVSLFLLPLLLLIVVAGAEYLGKLAGRYPFGEYTPALLVPVVLATLAQQPPPRAPEHIRPVIQYISGNWKPGDALWVYYGAGQAFLYYARLIPLDGDIQIGDCNRTDPRDYLRQVDIERGKPRVWVLMAHRSGAFRFDERRLITSYLDTIGERLDQFHAPEADNSSNRAEVILYDLSNAERLASSSADRFEVQNGYPPQTWTCYGTMSPLGRNERVVADVMGVLAP